MSDTTYDVPKDWELRKIKSLGKFQNGFGFPERFQGNTNEEIPFLKVSDINNPFDVYVDSASNYVSTKLSSTMSWSLTPIGSIIFPKIGVALLKNHRKINIKEVIIDNNMSAFVKRENINNKYLFYIFKELDMQNFVNISAVPSINFDLLKNFQIPITLDLKLQQQIVNYLDKKTAKIDATIAKIEELIDLLEEKRVALINQVVTKGLNPDVPMKDSGVEWIGEIPAHWEVTLARRFCKIETGGTPKREVLSYWENGTVNWMTSGEVNQEYVNDTKNKITIEGLNNSNAHTLPKNSIVMALSGQGQTKGRVAILNVPTCCSQSVGAFICDNTHIHYKYLFYYFKSRYYDIRGLVGDNLRDGLSLSIIGNIPTLIPPFEEQIKIANELDKHIPKINETIGKIEENIALLEEYKTSLIHHVVTGKIDVRGEEI